MGINETFYVKVLAISKDGSAYKVMRMGSAALTSSGQMFEWAVPLSPIPPIDGSGMQSSPASFSGLYALCTKCGTEQTFLLGFVTRPNGTNSKQPVKCAPNEPAGFGLTGKSGGGFKLRGDGGLSAMSENWAQWSMDPTSQSMFEQYRNHIVKWWTGSESYTTAKDTGTYEFFVAKEVDKSIIYPGTQAPPDSYKFEVGTLDVDALARWTIKCDANRLKKYSFTSKLLLGDVPGKKAIHYEQENAVDVTTTSKASADVNLDGGFTYTVEGSKVKTVFSINSELGDTPANGQVYIDSVGNDGAVKIKCDVAGPDIVSIDVNSGKCIVTIDKDGNVTFKIDKDAKMYLGGKEASQLLVTMAWVQQLFDKHMHPTAAPGLPSPPIMPSSTYPPASAASKTNFFTYKTFGE